MTTAMAIVPPGDNPLWELLLLPFCCSEAGVEEVAEAAAEVAEDLSAELDGRRVEVAMATGEVVGMAEGVAMIIDVCRTVLGACVGAVMTCVTVEGVASTVAVERGVEEGATGDGVIEDAGVDTGATEEGGVDDGATEVGGTEDGADVGAEVGGTEEIGATEVGLAIPDILDEVSVGTGV